MIEFILNDRIVKTEVKSGVTLLQFIREIEGMKGTKSGCKEGDCGACTVLSGILQKDDTIKYSSITSCLTPLANVDKRHIVTVEGLNLPNELNVSQNAIKEHHGTQCGYCTPGFVVSLIGYSLDTKVDAKAIDHLSGNICRCTGYKSIEKAANTVEELVKDKSIQGDINKLIEQKFIPEYFKEIPEKLKSLKSNWSEKGNQLVAGGTDLYVRFANELAEVNIKRHIDSVNTEINLENDILTIGAAATVTDIMENNQFNKHFPYLQDHLKLISSRQIRNMGTIAGNFVNASPIGDMSIFFLALDSKLTIIDERNKEREIWLKDFFKDYKSFDLKQGEIIKNISFRLPNAQSKFNFEKVSKRTHLDIASVNSAMLIDVEKDEIKNINISIGGVAAIPKYLFETKKYLLNKKITKENVINAQEIMQSEISPISDIRGTEQYKRLLARQLFYAHFIKIFPERFSLKNLIEK